MSIRKCSCGSDESPEPIYDGHGIYLCRACSQCRLEKLKEFRDDIFEHYDADEPIEPDDGPYNDAGLYPPAYADDLSNW